MDTEEASRRISVRLKGRSTYKSDEEEGKFGSFLLKFYV
jgi:hypothetical protein